MRSAIALGTFVLVLVTQPACEGSGRSVAPPPYPAAPAYYGPPRCVDGPAMCGADRASVVRCHAGTWTVLQACPGGCMGEGGAVQCAGAPPAQAGVGTPCAAEGGYDCTPDRRALTVCRGGRTALASTCRGARGCSVGTAVDCDHSVALVGDPCDGPKEIACAQDGRAMLRCVSGVYRLGEACRNACLSTSGRVLCQ